MEPGVIAQIMDGEVEGMKIGFLRYNIKVRGK